MCTSSLCNDNDFNGFSESPNQFLRKQLGPQRLTFNSVSDQGEIIANTIPYTNNESGNNVSTSDSNISRNSTSFLFLHPFTHKNNNTAPIPSLSHPNSLSINDTSKNTSIEFLYVDTTSVKALDTPNETLNPEFKETPREEDLLENEKDDPAPVFNELSFQEDKLSKELGGNDSNIAKHRVPRQAKGEQYSLESI